MEYSIFKFNMAEINSFLSTLPDNKTKIYYLKWLKNQIQDTVTILNGIKTREINYATHNFLNPEVQEFIKEMGQNVFNHYKKPKLKDYVSRKNIFSIFLFLDRISIYSYRSLRGRGSASYIRFLELCGRYIYKLTNYFLPQITNMIDLLESAQDNDYLQNKKQMKFEGINEKFSWQGTDTQLVYLIDQLFKIGLLNELLQHNIKWRLTANSFQKKNGTDYKNEQLAKTYQNLLINKKGKPSKHDLIDSILSEIEKI